ncbi:MAG TPA: GDSL-type esterase/lipase family protein [Cellvibrio sp.]|nr:GDSL-type esterase/lipase family protein [Cellvibrio sp.]
MTAYKKNLTRLLSIAALALSSQVSAAASPTPPSGINPTKRTVEYSWMSVSTWDKKHAEDTVVAQYDQVDLLFLGDSITDGWDWSIWEKNFKPLNAANFGIGGDNTGNVLWRLQHGAIGNLQPKLIVLLIGVNNLGALQESPEQAAAGVTRVVQQLQLAWPNSKILLNGVFPFDQDAKSPNRAKVKQLNNIIAKLQNSKITFKDYGPLLLQNDGNISPEIMKDFLHPTPKGYQIWADAMTQDIQSLLK